MKSEAILKYGVRPAGLFVCAATLLPFIRSSQWWIRVFDFPRVQVTTLAGATLLAGELCRRSLKPSDRKLLALVGASMAVQAAQIYPYTRFAPQRVAVKSAQPETSFSVLVANVYERNHNAKKLLSMIHEKNPDFVLLMETDDWWADHVKTLESAYPYHVRCPLANTYGMMLFSKFELINPEVRFLIESGVPSIRTQVRLKSGLKFTLFCVHPKPPARHGPGRLLRRSRVLRHRLWRWVVQRSRQSDEYSNNADVTLSSAPRDAELVLVAKEVRELNGPALIIGDFNDVAWSHTTKLFQRIGKLLDPREGRGFYSTFHARWPFLRFPLDHLFHTEHFTTRNFERLDYFGSDHFPIFATVGLGAAPAKEQKAPQMDPEDEAEAEEKLNAVV